jgi:drug/metabolite transporter (DMT)-like permease
MNVVILLSLCAAITYGLSDFIGGVLTRRVSAWAVAVASQGAALVVAVLFALTAVTMPSASALAWGTLAGLGSGAGNVLIYRGLGSGRMTVVAPVSALTAAILPVFAGIVSGERPGVIALIGVAAALPAVWLVSGGGAGLRGANRGDVVNGLAAGLGFGTQFSALGQIPADAGLTPLALSQVVSVASIVIVAIAWSAPWVPRDRHSRLGVFAGLLAGIATICFQLATQSGMLTIAGVLTSLYPAITVVMAAALLRERVRPLQSVGLLLAGGAVALIASG